ncbi:hypothetical protein CHS0354_032805 [Potamilus streckersoni]|uniref:Uncharacterized protein n=1 Tax=Potamilus streckersoni TaxID=2493646 RepID=A0AAE0S985_9BIVA|nr:hypothetical protein CHS0354_032805 [Potamilus streckersoni]
MEAEFAVQYLGDSMLSKGTTGLGVIQKPLKDKYFQYRKSDDRKYAPDISIRIKPSGICLVFPKGYPGKRSEEYFDISSVHYVEAVRFVTEKKEKKQYFAFIPMDEASATNASTEKLFSVLEKKYNFLLKQHHPPIVACVMRRTSGVKAVDCHMFITYNESDAFGISSVLNSFQKTGARDYSGPPSGPYRPSVYTSNQGIQDDMSKDRDEVTLRDSRQFERRDDYFRDSSRGEKTSYDLNRSSGSFYERDNIREDSRSFPKDSKEYLGWEREDRPNIRYDDRYPNVPQGSRYFEERGRPPSDHDKYGRPTSPSFPGGNNYYDDKEDKYKVHEMRRAYDGEQREFLRPNQVSGKYDNKFDDRYNNRRSDDYERNRDGMYSPRVIAPPPSPGFRDGARPPDMYIGPLPTSGDPYRKSTPGSPRGPLTRALSPGRTRSPPRARSPQRALSPVPRGPPLDEAYSASNLESRQEFDRGSDSRGRPVAKVPPHMVGGIKVLPTGGFKVPLKPATPRSPPISPKSKSKAYDDDGHSDENSPYDNAYPKIVPQGLKKATRPLSDNEKPPYRNPYGDAPDRFIEDNRNLGRSKSEVYYQHNESYDRPNNNPIERIDSSKYRGNGGSGQPWSYQEEIDKFSKNGGWRNEYKSHSEQDFSDRPYYSERGKGSGDDSNRSGSGRSHSRDAEIADMFTNLRTGPRPFDANLEQGLGYLP